uniref:Protein CHUP1, chloroplastic n=1 Tax=Oryza nivara TaxID=4536 RepID=A0A0E0HWS5_ORYNI
MYADQPKMKHQLLGASGGASRSSRAAAAAAPPAKTRPAVARSPVRASGNSKDEKKSESESEALRREVDRLRRRNEELEQQLALAHRTVAQLWQQQQQVAAAKNSQAPSIPPKPAPAPPPPLPPTSATVIPQGVPVPPPPPPPPNTNGNSKSSRRNQQGPSKATALVNMYNSSNTNIAASGIVGELQNRSTHLLAIKADLQAKAGLINHLIAKLQQITFADVDQVLTFVDWLDQQLSTLLAREKSRCTPGHLNSLLTQISKYPPNDDPTLTSCEAILTKTSALQHKLEKSMSRLVNLRSLAMPSYKELRIPTDWMLDSGIASKMRLASLKLAKVYVKRALKELDRETGGEALLAQTVHFAYRVHQFAGGLDCEAMCLFEDLTKRPHKASSPLSFLKMN